MMWTIILHNHHSRKKNMHFALCRYFFHVNREKFKSFTEGHSYLTTKAKRFFWKKKHLPCIFNVRVKIIFGIFHKAVIGSRQKLVLFPKTQFLQNYYVYSMWAKNRNVNQWILNLESIHLLANRYLQFVQFYFESFSVS